jgi:type I restriction enzyme S subunit
VSDEGIRRRLKWAPDIPPAWDVVNLKMLARIFAGGTPDRKNMGYWEDGTVPWLNSGSVNDWAISKPSELISSTALSDGATRCAPKGSVLIALAGQGKTKGMSARLELDSTFNQSLAAIVPGRSLEYRFLQYWLTSNYLNIRGLAGGDLRDGLNLQHIGAIQVPRPPLHEQRAIADYLDRETAQVDAFIAKNEELITLLAERRAASIDEAFDRVDAPLTRLKYRASIQTGVTLGGEGSPSDPEWPYLRVANVQVGRVELSEIKSVRVPEHRAGQSLLRAGDVLLTEGGDRDKLGRGALWSGEIAPMLHQNHVFAVKVGRNLDARFLMRWLDASPARRHFESTAVQTTNLASTNKTLVGNLPLPSCPIQTQLGIVSDLDSRLEKIDGAIGVTERSVKLARERRAALISAAVTGKIEVGAAV